MRIPLSPPPLDDLLQQLLRQGPAALELLALARSVGPCDNKGRYLHWDKLRHLPPPEGLTSEQYWLATKMARQAIQKPLPLLDKTGQPMTFSLPDVLIRDLLWISENATGAIQADARITDDKIRKTYLMNSLIEEAITSSQLEGASTTRRVAKEMLRSGRAPQNHSERMIANNYQAMAFIRSLKSELLTPSIIFELHKILTEGTLDAGDEHKAGILRQADDDICVYSHDDVLLHVPPRSADLRARLQAICDFANHHHDDEGGYLPPVIRAIIVHFMIGYDHPFVDGNGRTARALFYWVMAREGYWLMEYISLSRVLKKAPAQYMYAYLYSETDDNDVTYFIFHQIHAIREAIDDLHDYLALKSRQLHAADNALGHSALRGLLNHRQLSLLKNALENPGAEYTIKSHQNAHGVTYQTARTDLLMLSDQYAILKKFKSGKKDVFIAPPDIQQQLDRIKP
ncbi:MAG TPA: Fic family protein [Pseudomonadales bacterium]